MVSGCFNCQYSTAESTWTQETAFLVQIVLKSRFLALVFGVYYDTSSSSSSSQAGRRPHEDVLRHCRHPPATSERAAAASRGLSQNFCIRVRLGEIHQLNTWREKVAGVRIRTLSRSWAPATFGNRWTCLRVGCYPRVADASETGGPIRETGTSINTRAMAAPCCCHLLNTKAVTSLWRGTAGVFVSDDSRGKEG
eukprot:2331884-Rhodomonas_salina.1